jgi:hypothetical protein
MRFQEHYFFLCRVKLDAKGPQDVEIIAKAETSVDFPAIYEQYEELKSIAYNEDGLYSIVRANEIIVLVRTPVNPKEAKIRAYDEAVPNLITNLQHRVMQKKDADAKRILKEVHDIEEL